MKHQFSDRHKALLAVIVEARQQSKLSQRQLSEKIKRSRSFIQRAEQGERVLDFLEVIDIAEALDIDPIDFLDRVLSYGKPVIPLEPIQVTSKKRKKAKR